MLQQVGAAQGPQSAKRQATNAAPIITPPATSARPATNDVTTIDTLPLLPSPLPIGDATSAASSLPLTNDNPATTGTYSVEATPIAVAPSRREYLIAAANKQQDNFACNTSSSTSSANALPEADSKRDDTGIKLVAKDVPLINNQTGNSIDTNQHHDYIQASNQQQSKTTKLNGLRNRIIQRPPPLILDKVSNFYDNETTDTNTVTQPTNHITSNNASNTVAGTTANHITTQQSTQQTTFGRDVDAAIAAHHNANQKFWASLNQNAKARNFTSSSSLGPQTASSSTSTSQAIPKESVGNSPLGADLIITHRDSSASINAPTANAMLSQKVQSKTNQDMQQGGATIISSIPSQFQDHPSDENQNKSSSLIKASEENRETEVDGIVSYMDEDDFVVVDAVLPKSHDLSEADKSEFDDSGSAHATSNLNDSECDGGNLIGVDNPTPPASAGFTASSNQVYGVGNVNQGSITAPKIAAAEEPPPSASSSRPRSNNPFLFMDEDLNTPVAIAPKTNSPATVYDANKPPVSNSETRSKNTSNFHHRPASFIAATGRAPPNQDNCPKPDSLEQQIQFHELTLNSHELDQQQHYAQKQFNQLQISNDHYNNRLNQQEHFARVQQRKQPQSQLDENNYSHHHPAALSQSVEDSTILYQQTLINPSHQNQLLYQHVTQSRSPPHDMYGRKVQDSIGHQPTISIDSESAVCKPPPSATMQLPYWTEAIYELNNAILERNSVAGGSENGQFIYIVESGDIILELDNTQVSGYTLCEFNEFVESKPTHKLRAVQTKHAQGIQLDLKQYLSLSFLKNSRDKELQDLIRENIYRRTIPCTSRPPKEGEVDGIDYHFITRDQFIDMNNKGILLECGMYGGHFYGTLKPFSDLGTLPTSESTQPRELTSRMHRPLNVSHPALGLSTNRSSNENLYENHESMKMHRMYLGEDGSSANMNGSTATFEPPMNQRSNFPKTSSENSNSPAEGTVAMPLTDHVPVKGSPSIDANKSNIVSVDNEALPHGWERVIDQTHGTYYIDHNTKRTQYERPYEIQLTKGIMGFGFTLVEAENGALLVRSIIQGGPAYMNGSIRPGDILISAVGVPVANLSHTDIARLFSTFAVGDRVRLTFARTTYVFDDNLVPDEYLFSNGTNGDLALAVNADHARYRLEQNVAQVPDFFDREDSELIRIILKRGDQGFGFTISDSGVGQKVRKIQNSDVGANLKQGDILISLNGVDITSSKHKEVVELLKSCPIGQDVTLIVKRKKRFRSKTPTALHTESGEQYSTNTPQRNCKTPTLDGLMLSKGENIDEVAAFRRSYAARPELNDQVYSQAKMEAPMNYYSLSDQPDAQAIYGTRGVADNQIYYNQIPQNNIPRSKPPPPPPPAFHQMDSDFYNHGPSSIASSNHYVVDHRMTSANPIDMKMNQSHLRGHAMQMKNKELVLMRNQPYQQQHSLPTIHQDHYSLQQQLPMTTSDYHQMPLYSNSELLNRAEPSSLPPMPLPLPMKPTINPYAAQSMVEPVYNSFYANNQEIAMQRQYASYPGNSAMSQQATLPSVASVADQLSYTTNPSIGGTVGEHDDYEYHQVDLDRDSSDSNWGIRLIGGSEVDRAISIGSIVFGGAASKNGNLKSGDEIISINGVDVVGSTHQHVVELISACTNRASLVVRRRKFADACQVTLTRNMDEGFGFVIISSGNCALIGRIIEGSPADRCQQLHVKDRIIAVNRRYITPDMQHPEIVNMIKKSGSELHLSIIPADCYTVELIKSSQNENFGFTMRGGSEFDGTPLYILRVAPDGLARDLLNVGDQILEINNLPTVGMTHQQAAFIIKCSDPIVKLKLRRNYVTPPSLLVDSPRALQKFNQVTAEMKTINHQVVTQSYSRDDSISSEFRGSSSGTNQQLASMPMDATPQLPNGSSMMSNQSMPLYAS